MNTEDKIIEKLIEIDGKMATVEQIDRLDKRIDGIIDQLDKQLVILQRLDQERVFMTEWIRRIEKEIDTLKLKLQVV